MNEDNFQRYQFMQNFDGNHEDDILLYKNGMLVDDDMDERAIVDFDRGHLAYSKEKRHFRILTTTACNARCFYCYESGVDGISMNETIMEKTFEYIKMQTKNVQEFSITWFGGEPLLNTKVIDGLSDRFNDYATKCNKTWSASIVSNGSLINDEIISKIKTFWNVNSVQITLDGLKENYNRIKAYVDQTSFDNIIENIKKLCAADIRTTIRLNFDKNNYEDIMQLIFYLSAELNSYDHWSIYVYPIFDNVDGSYDDECISKIVELEKVIVTSTGRNENDIIGLPKYSHGRCVFCSVAGETILPNGDLMKCCRHIGKEKPFASILDEKIYYNSNYARWCTVTLPLKCNNCELLPICQGGCRAEQLIGQDGCLPRARVIDKVIINYVDNLLACESKSYQNS